MNIASSVERGRQAYPDRTALLYEGDSISYAQLDEQASRAASALQALAIRRGDRVALWLPNTPPFVYYYLGILKLGAIAVSVNTALKEDEVRYILEDSGAAALVTSVPLPGIGLPMILPDRLAAQASVYVASEVMDAASPAVIVYTSGTTGFPKGATLSHGNVMFTMEAKKRYLGIQPEDRLLLFLPLHHCFGQNAILNAGLHAGASLALYETFDAGRLLDTLARDGVTMFFGVPTTFIVLQERASLAQLQTIRYFFSAAAPLPEEAERAWQRKFGALIHQGYGLTETSPFATYNHLTHHKPGSVGTAIEGVDVRAVNLHDGRFQPAGTVGELVIRGPNVMLGYWNRPEETGQAVREGWFHTGDIGRVDESGYVFVEDRLKDMILVGGCNVYPAEVENTLYQHRSVDEAAVYGVRDAVLGERVMAAVKLRPGPAPSPGELIAHCRQRLADFKVPVEVEFLPELPRNRSGKILKRILRERQRPLFGSSSVVAGAAALERRITGWLGEKLRIEAHSLERGRPFAEFGLTSLLAVELAESLGAWVGKPVKPAITWSFSTIETLARHLTAEESHFQDEHARSMAEELSRLSEQDAEAMLLQEINLLRL